VITDSSTLLSLFSGLIIAIAVPGSFLFEDTDFSEIIFGHSQMHDINILLVNRLGISSPLQIYSAESEVSDDAVLESVSNSLIFAVKRGPLPSPDCSSSASLADLSTSPFRSRNIGSGFRGAVPHIPPLLARFAQACRPWLRFAAGVQHSFIIWEQT
jgi:hypothetical protein